MNEDLKDPTQEKCPTCKGKKIISCKYYDTLYILKRLIHIKKNKYVKISSPMTPAYRLKFPCPFCVGTGYIDWIRKATRGTYNRPSWSIDGCLRILFDELNNNPEYAEYSVNPNYHSNKEFLNLPHLINSSQDRYQGLIKLDESFLKMGLRELNSIQKRVRLAINKIYSAYPYPEMYLAHPKLYTRLPKILVPTEKYIEKVSDDFGLSQYKPDKYAHLNK